ncbi:MAG: fructose-6-phosphate aldolase [Candidatus Diapherotrites archaeon]|nr:fructose-6-phosphate aldolase [Candidatus Micrarchaeota archaeon]
MEIFVDTAEVEEVRKAAEWGLADGVTTNPTLVARAGRNFAEVVKEICGIVNGPVSAEVVSEDSEGMVKEAMGLVKIHKNVIIKVPMTAEGMKAVRALKKKGVRTNVTLVFSANQALIAAKAGADYVSPFVGRLDDKGEKGMDVIDEILEVYGNYGFKTKVIVASVRSAEHVKEAALLGADVATVPFKVLEEMFRHELTDAGIKKFLEDWETVKGK